VVLSVILPGLFAQHPDTSIELIETADLSDMARREADIAIRVVRPEQGDDLVLKRLRDVELGVFASPGYLATLSQPLDPAALRWVVFSRPGGVAGDWLEEHLPGARIVLRCTDPTTARLAVVHGVGAGIVPQVYARIPPVLQEIDVGLPGPPVGTLWLVGHRAVIDLPAVRRVWDFLDETLHDRPDRDGTEELIRAHALGLRRSEIT
jgi:DNA-binding transcriptional LysR family regulator